MNQGVGKEKSNVPLFHDMAEYINRRSILLDQRYVLYLEPILRHNLQAQRHGSQSCGTCSMRWSDVSIPEPTLFRGMSSIPICRPTRTPRELPGADRSFLHGLAWLPGSEYRLRATECTDTPPLNVAMSSYPRIKEIAIFAAAEANGETQAEHGLGYYSHSSHSGGPPAVGAGRSRFR